jgi:hypothetical protein
MKQIRHQPATFNSRSTIVGEVRPYHWRTVNAVVNFELVQRHVASPIPEAVAPTTGTCSPSASGTLTHMDKVAGRACTSTRGYRDGRLRGCSGEEAFAAPVAHEAESGAMLEPSAPSLLSALKPRFDRAPVTLTLNPSLSSIKGRPHESEHQDLQQGYADRGQSNHRPS